MNDRVIFLNIVILKFNIYKNNIIKVHINL